MGQQQLMLIVLGVVIVGIAVTVGINMFSSGAIDANRDQVISQVVHLSSKAQTFFRKPASMGGGDNSFAGYKLSASEKGTAGTTNAYRVEKDEAPTAPEAASITEEIPAAGAATIYLVGYGTETGNDGTNPVMVVATITSTAVTTAVVN